MNSKTMLINTNDFSCTPMLPWWKMHKNIYTYPNSKNIHNDNKDLLSGNVLDKNLKKWLIEHAGEGIIIFSENEKFKNKIKKLIPTVISENESNGIISYITVGDGILYETPIHCLMTDDELLWFQFDENVEPDDYFDEYMLKYVCNDDINFDSDSDSNNSN
jgi:hypothetical protein